MASNFKTLVLQSTYDVLVLFDSDQCHQCKALKVIYEEVAERLRNNRYIRFYWINTSKNEILGVGEVSAKPLVRFYAHRDKTQPLDFSGYRRVVEIIRQLERKTS